MQPAFGRTIKKIGITVFSLLVIVSYQNCGKVPLIGGSTDNDNSSSAPPRTMRAQNYLTETKPALLCGEEGYSFLMRNYLVQYCGACHDGTVNLGTIAFANAKDVKTSYGGAKFITKSDFITTTTANRFCGTDCSISYNSETYKALVEWLDHRDCPQ